MVAEGRMLPSLRELWQMGTTFLLTVLAWVFFRATSIPHALTMLKGIVTINKWSGTLFTLNLKQISAGADVVYVSLFILFLLLIEWKNRSKSYSLYQLKVGGNLNYIIYLLFIVLIWSQTKGGETFIYFQF